MSLDPSEKLNDLLSELGLLNHKDEKLWSAISTDSQTSGERLLINRLPFSAVTTESSDDEPEEVVLPLPPQKTEVEVAVSKQWEMQLQDERRLAQEGLRIEIADDSMFAFLYISDNMKEVINKDLVQRHLERNRIKFGIDWEAIDAAIEKVQKGGEIISLQIAEGVPAQAGHDGEVLFYFEKSRVLKKRKRQNTSTAGEEKVDFKNFGFLNMVNKGQLLAEKFMPVAGISGHDVMGRVLACPAVKEPPLMAGKNTFLENGQLFSKVDGMPIYELSGSVSVDSIFTVSGDVNLTVGNIKFNGNILISGSVLTGFTVEAGGDVVVRGSVEGAAIIAGGNITIERGFVGGEKGLLRSGGDCYISYANGGAMECGGNLFVQRELINCRVFVVNNLEFLFRKGSLIGGNISVTGDLDVFNLGSSLGTTTNIYMGNRKFLRKHLEKISIYLDALNKKLKLLGLVIDAMESNSSENHNYAGENTSLSELLGLLGMSSAVGISDQHKEKLQQLLHEKRHFLTRERDDFQEKAAGVKADLDKYMPHFVRVRGKIFPGVNIVINDAEDYKNCDMGSDIEFYEDPQTRKICHRPCMKRKNKEVL